MSVEVPTMVGVCVCVCSVTDDSTYQHHTYSEMCFLCCCTPLVPARFTSVHSRLIIAFIADIKMIINSFAVDCSGDPLRLVAK